MTHREVSKDAGFELLPGLKMNKVRGGCGLVGSGCWPGLKSSRTQPHSVCVCSLFLPVCLFNPSALTPPRLRPRNQPPTNAQGEMLYVSNYCVQRDEEYWPKALEFLPERFMPVSLEGGK